MWECPDNPNLDDEKKLIQFERAERLRKQCEFDKAAGIYETIVADFREEAEAYWGLVLCKYGIEYVDDPATGKKIPTCHRTSFDSVMDDADFEQALENADSLARKVYREEAKAIEEIRKGIVEVSAKEEPYDIFICYKETDEKGNRTIDSVLAQDVYDALTEKGYRVFFARISLEDKLGLEYEPYIFAALNSAKVMLAFGTDYEYFNAVWVKNEWARFLELMAKDKSKHLIPCYKGIDAYDMPKEFKALQAQDLGKVGAVQDLLRGIEKLLPKKQVEKETVVVQQSATNTTEPLLKRAFMFLEDGDWAKADEFCEQVLNQDPECALGYLGKLLAELRVKKQEFLRDQGEPFDANNSYQKVIRFADSNLKTFLTDTIAFINERNAREEEDDRLARARKEEEQSKKAEKIAKRNKKIAKIAIPIVGVIIAFIIVLNSVIIPSIKYNNAIALMDAENIVGAYEALIALDDYKDSAEKASSIYRRYKLEKLKTEKIEVGDYILLGSYEQDGNTTNGTENIEWKVLAAEGNRCLVISKYILFLHNFGSKNQNVTWENSAVRKTINNQFINSAFTEEEAAIICTTAVFAETNPECNIDPGNNTVDQLFLLSISEASKYFVDDSDRKCSRIGKSPEGWWLRTPSDGLYRTSNVDSTGDISTKYGWESYRTVGVRPAMWIEI